MARYWKVSGWSTPHLWLLLGSLVVHRSNCALVGILRRNLFSIDGGDIGQKLAEDINQLVVDLKIARNPEPEDVTVYA